MLLDHMFLRVEKVIDYELSVTLILRDLETVITLGSCYTSWSFGIFFNRWSFIHVFSFKDKGFIIPLRKRLLEIEITKPIIDKGVTKNNTRLYVLEETVISLSIIIFIFCVFTKIISKVSKFSKSLRISKIIRKLRPFVIMSQDLVVYTLFPNEKEEEDYIWSYF